jgi:hypothetical protein
VEVPFEDLLVKVDDEELTLELLHGSRWLVEVTDITTCHPLDSNVRDSRLACPL